MRKKDTITIAEFGNFIIEAEYDYRLECRSKPGTPVEPEDINVEKVELHIKRMRSKRIPGTKEYKHSYDPVSTIRLLDIPPWLWSLLNDEEVLQELDLTLPERDPDDMRDDARDIAEEQRERLLPDGAD